MLSVEPRDRILEIGCGRGFAVELICERLADGRITGIDRSPIAITAAESRNRRFLHSGKARLLNVALAEAVFNDSFDKVFAVNVNLFWLNPAKELAVIRQVLAPGGRLFLFYEPPSTAQLERARESCSTFLAAAGFAVVDTLIADLSPNLGLCLVAGGITLERRLAPAI